MTFVDLVAHKGAVQIMFLFFLLLLAIKCRKKEYSK